MRSWLRSLMIVLAFATGAAYAADTPFTQGGFDALQKSGKPTLVMIHADWCPTCKAQAPILGELLGSPEFKAVNALRVDFDNQKDALKAFKATMQSTLIVYKGGKEVGRSTGDTKKDSITALLKKAI